MKRQQDLLFSIISKHTGQPVDRIADDFERDRWMDAHMAKEYGLVDDILGQPPTVRMEDDSKKGDAKKGENVNGQ